MDRFKAVLRKGLEMRVERISLVQDQQVSFFLGGSPSGQPEYGLLDRNWIQTLYQSLFSQELPQLKEGKNAVGSFQLQGIGRVYLIGEPKPASALHLFMPPDGEGPCKTYWEQLNRPVPPPPPPPPPTVSLSPESSSEKNDPYAQTPVSPADPPSSGKPQSSTASGIPSFSLSGLNEPGVQDDRNMFGGGPTVATPKTSSPATSKASSPLTSAGLNKSEPTKSIPKDHIAGSLSFDPMASGLDMFAGSGSPSFSENQGQRPSNSVSSSEEYVPDIAPDLFTSNPVSRENPFSFASDPEPGEDASPFESGAAAVGTFSGHSFSQEEIAGSMKVPEAVPLYAGSKPLSASGQEIIQESYVAPVEANKSAPAYENMFVEQVPGTISKGTGLNPIDGILKSMIENRASDLHMTNGQPVILRVDGDICRARGEVLTESSLRKYLFPIMPDDKKREFAETWDADFAYEVENIGRFRVNMFRDYHGVGAVLRHIPSRVLTAKELNLPDSITRLCRLAKGLILVTGPTGSGKSTTLAAMIDLINSSRSEHILTIEDPIEFVHQQKKCLINQREVGKHTHGFSAALRAALREDPDIVLVGELRDLETTSIALETAETGHLVFATLHTNTAISTVDRIIDQFPADQQRIIRNMLASSMKGVIAQTLCKRKGGGRVAAYEILLPNDAVASMVREGKNHMLANHMQTQQADGNILINEALTRLVLEDKVDYREAWNKAVDKKDFEEQARRKRIQVPPPE